MNPAAYHYNDKGMDLDRMIRVIKLFVEQMFKLLFKVLFKLVLMLLFRLVLIKIVEMVKVIISLRGSGTSEARCLQI